MSGVSVWGASNGTHFGAGVRADARTPMIGLPRGVDVYLFGEQCDMRRSFNTLTLVVEQKLGKTLVAGDLFVFVSADRNRSAGDPWFVVTPGGRRAMVARIAALSLGGRRLIPASSSLA